MGKANSRPTGAAQTQSKAVAVEPQHREAEHPQAGSGAGCTLGSVPRGLAAAQEKAAAWKSTSPKGADDFLLGIEAAGRSSRWCFGCCWGKERGCRSSPWPLVGWRWPWYPWPSLGNSPTAAQQITKCSSTG